MTNAGAAAPDFVLSSTPGQFWQMHAALFEHKDALEDTKLGTSARGVGPPRGVP